jgi:hypothetical protein
MKYYIMWHGETKDKRFVSGYGKQQDNKERAEYLAMSMERLTGVPHFVGETE